SGPEFRRPDRAGQQSRRNASNRFRHLGALEYAPKLRTVKQKPPAIGGCLLGKPRMLVGGVIGNEVEDQLQSTRPHRRDERVEIRNRGRTAGRSLRSRRRRNRCRPSARDGLARAIASREGGN